MLHGKKMIGNQNYYLALVRVRTKTHPAEQMLTTQSALVCMCPPKENGMYF